MNITIKTAIVILIMIHLWFFHITKRNDLKGLVIHKKLVWGLSGSFNCCGGLRPKPAGDSLASFSVNKDISASTLPFN
jgi:hypothetical protein